MNKYAEDKAESQINTRLLEKEFELSSQAKEIQDMRDSLNEVSSNQSPDDILYENIQRANRLLDKAEEELNEGGVNNRLLEVCGQLINAVTSASTSIVGNSYEEEMELKRKRLELEEKKIMIKEAVGKKAIEGPSTTNTTINTIVMNRENLLQMIEDAENGKEIDISSEM